MLEKPFGLLLNTRPKPRNTMSAVRSQMHTTHKETELSFPPPRAPSPLGCIPYRTMELGFEHISTFCHFEISLGSVQRVCVCV